MPSYNINNLILVSAFVDTQLIDNTYSLFGLLNATFFHKVYSPTGPVNRDYEDIRCYYDAACKGMKR